MCILWHHNKNTNIIILTNQLFSNKYVVYINSRHKVCKIKMGGAYYQEGRGAYYQEGRVKCWNVHLRGIDWKENHVQHGGFKLRKTIFSSLMNKGLINYLQVEDATIVSNGGKTLVRPNSDWLTSTQLRHMWPLAMDVSVRFFFFHNKKKLKTNRPSNIFNMAYFRILEYLWSAWRRDFTSK